MMTLRMHQTTVTITHFQDSPTNVMIKWTMNEDTDFSGIVYMVQIIRLWRIKH